MLDCLSTPTETGKKLESKPSGELSYDNIRTCVSYHLDSRVHTPLMVVSSCVSDLRILRFASHDMRSVHVCLEAGAMGL